MSKEVIIVGGGLAGISAALEALECGMRPIVLEKSHSLGGRARSLYARDVKAPIDHGQHLLSASYHHTLQLLQKLGTLSLIAFQKRLFIHFIFPEGQSIAFRAYNIPPPFHFLLPLLVRPEISWKEKLGLIQNGLRIFQQKPPQRASLTVEDWIRPPRPHSTLKMILWQPLSLAVLNTPMEEASARLLRNAFRMGFLSSNKCSGLGFPQKDLSQIFGEPARKYILKHGGSVYIRTQIRRLIIENDRVKAVVGPQGKVFETPALVLALPPDALQPLLKPHADRLADVWNALQVFRFSPIVTINIWTQRPIEHPLPIAFVDSPFHWLVHLPWVFHRTGFQGYAVVSSAASRLAACSAEAIMEQLRNVFQRCLGLDLDRDLHLKQYKIIKEKRATIIQTPRADSVRPRSRTRISNLVLAGDWIQTHFPATIESAVISGKMAIRSLRC